MNIETLVSISNQSSSLAKMALSIIGGSILTILSTSYNKPLGPKMKLIYLMFIPGWSLLAASMYKADVISRKLIAAHVAHTNNKVALLKEIGGQMNETYAFQADLFQFGFLVFVVWLVIFLLWWVFDRQAVFSSK